MKQNWGNAQGWVAVGVMSTVGWVAGVALPVLWPRLPSAALLQALVAAGAGLGLAVLLCAVRRRHHGAWAVRGRPAMLCAVGAAAALVALGSMGLRTAQRLEARLPHAWEGVPLLVQGTVVGLPQRSAQGLQFVFSVEAAHTLAGEPVQVLARAVWLGWWREAHVDVLVAAALPEPRPGERWQLPVTLKRPHGTLNPGTFDAERWFLEQDLGASGSVAMGHRGLVRRLEGPATAWAWFERQRARVRDRIDAHVHDDALAGLVAGLTIGDQASVHAQDWQLFRAAGVAHALSISGAHITVFAALAAPSAAWLWRRWPSACLVCPAPWVGLWVGWLLALAYALLAGWGLPAQRTVAMLAVVCLARTLQLNWPAVVVWIWAAAPIVVFDPWAVWQAGFWLSFAAVGLLILTGQPTHRPGLSDARETPAPGGYRGLCLRLRPLWEAMRVQVFTSVGLAPLAAVCFGEVSVVGVVGNLLALPWITLVLTPLCLLGVLWPALWGLLPWVVEPLRAVMAALVSLPGSVVGVPGSSAWALGLALVGAWLALMRGPPALGVSGLALMLPLLVPAPRPPGWGEAEVWGLDVGQGTAVLVRTRHHALLLDAGPAWGEGRDAGDRVVVPFLRHRGVGRLDELVVTHRDLDHVGGAASVIRALPVARLRSTLEPSHPLLKLGIQHQPCRRGQRWQWDGVSFEVLHPWGHESRTAKPNALSCVLRVEDAQGRSLLLTGDIEREQEQALQDAFDGAGLRADGLIVPHHGSRTSSTEGFLQAVQPRWALAQAGYRNRYGHPAPAVVQRYADRGIPLLSSPWCGALLWQGAQPQCWRVVQPRHWHDQPAAQGPSVP